MAPQVHPKNIYVPVFCIQMIPVADQTLRCNECTKIARRARFASQGESMGTRYANARWQSSQRGLEFTLTLGEYQQTVSQPCVYAYSPIPPTVKCWMPYRYKIPCGRTEGGRAIGL